MTLREMLNRALLERKIYKVLRELSMFGLDKIYRTAKELYQNEHDIKYGTDYHRQAQQALASISDNTKDTMMRQALVRLSAASEDHKGDQDNIFSMYGKALNDKIASTSPKYSLYMDKAPDPMSLFNFDKTGGENDESRGKGINTEKG